MTYWTPPDWSDASAYPRPSSQRRLFAWEFLRRNAGYVADWKRFVALGGFENDEDPICAVRAEIAHRWGLQLPHPPELSGDSLPWPCWSRTSGISMPGPAADHLTTAGRMSTGKVALTFDLTMPLVPQLKSASNYLAETQRRWLRAHPRHIAARPPRAGKTDGRAFVEMLRVLDADAAGAKRAALIAALWPGELDEYPDYPLRKRLSTRRATAQEYRDGKYLELALRDVDPATR
jgi:hypothetical protein